MRDWSQFNRMMDTVLYYMMQKRLGEQRAKQSMAYLKESQEGNELLAKMKHNLELEAEGKKNDLERDMVFLEAVMRANEDTTLEHFKKLGQLYADKDPKLAATYMGKYEEGMDKLITGVIEEEKGKTTREGKAGLFGQAGLKTGLDISKEARGAYEYDTTLPITRQQADTSAAQAGTSRGRLLLDIKKEGKEETGELSHKEYADDVIPMIDDATDFIDNYEETDIGTEEGQRKMSEGPGILDSDTKITKVRIKLQELKLKVIKGEFLTDNEEKFITSVSNVSGTATGLEEKTLPGMAYSPEGKALTEKVGSELFEEKVMKVAQMIIDGAIQAGKQVPTMDVAKEMAREQLKLKR